MEEVKSKYIKLLVVFSIIMAVATFILRQQINSMTNASKINQAIETIGKVADEPHEMTPEEMQEAYQKHSSEESETEAQDVANNEMQSAEQAIDAPNIVNPNQVNPNQVNPNQVNPNQEGMAPEETLPPSIQNGDFEQEGLSKMSEGDYDNAIINFEKAIETGDTEKKKSSLQHLAECYEKMNDMQNVINTYIRSLEVTNDDYERRTLNQRIADYYININQKEIALGYLEDNYRISMMASDVISIGEVLMELNDKNKMKMYLDEYLARNPQDREMLIKYIDWSNSDESNQG